MLSADEHHRAPLLWLLGPYIAGLVAGAAGAGGPPFWIVAGAAALAGSAIAAAASRRWPALAAWALAAALAAFGGGLVQMQRALAEEPRWRALPPREVALELELTKVFPPPPEGARRSCTARIVAAPRPMDDLVGQRVFFAAAFPAGEMEPVPTLRLRVRGVIESLEFARAQAAGESGAQTSFDAYLLGAGVRFRLSRAQPLEVTQPARLLPRWWRALDRRFEAILRRGLPAHHPATGVYVAMFLGRKSELSDVQKQNYLRSGTMHLFAISGLHITVIALCLQSLLSFARVPPRAGLVAGLVVLWVFVEATGGTPSARRALLMVAFIGAGRFLRRPSNPLAALVGSAAVVLVLDPLALLSASFQLSYAVVAALLLYAAPLQNRIAAHWHPFRELPAADWRWWHEGVFAAGRGLISLVSSSVAATMISAPLCFAYFGLASPGGVLANLVLVPVTGYAITAGFVSLVCGLPGALPLSAVFNFAAALILAVVDTLARWAAAMPGMFVTGTFAHPWIAPALLFGLLALCVAGYAAGWHRWRWNLAVPPVVLIAALFFCVTPPPPARQSATMKSAYELAMERLSKNDPEAGAKLTDAQKAELAEIDRVFTGRVAEREIFLRQRLAEVQAKGEAEEIEKLNKQIASERARLAEEREDAKNRVRRTAAGGR